MEQKVNDTLVVENEEALPTGPVETIKEPVPFFNREPVMIMAAVQAGLALAMGFGLSITLEQMGLILGFSAAVLALITRQQVTPFVNAGTTPNVHNSNKTPLVG